VFTTVILHLDDANNMQVYFNAVQLQLRARLRAPIGLGFLT
jgi:hypothetical protein